MTQVINGTRVKAPTKETLDFSFCSKSLFDDYIVDLMKLFP